MDKEIAVIKKREEQGLSSMLVTIVADSGSAPRGSGASMIVGETGLVAGTIGGGMLEFQAIKEAQQLLTQRSGALKTYGLTKDAVAKLGMVCGGKVEVLFTYLAAGEANSQTLARLEAVLAARQAGWLLLPLSGLKLGFVDGSGIYGLELPLGKTEITAVKTQEILETNLGPCYVRKLENRSRVFVFGGGHLAQEVVPLLAHIGFRCIVTDDRPEFSTPSLFPAAEAVYTRDFKTLSGHYDVHPEDYIIAVTRGHVGDFDVQVFALRTPAGYIGVVGSRSKIAAVNAKLFQEGFTKADIARVTAPIGLDIGSETPAEIAVSIAAQLIEKRAGKKL